MSARERVAVARGAVNSGPRRPLKAEKKARDQYDLFLFLFFSPGRQTQRGSVRVPQPLPGHNGRHRGRAKRDDRRHGPAGHRLPDQRAATADHARGRATPRTGQGVDPDERDGPRRQSGKPKRNAFGVRVMRGGGVVLCSDRFERQFLGNINYDIYSF